MSEGLLSADALLAHAGKLAEDVAELPEAGKVLCRELDGETRALVLTVLSSAATGGQVDFKRYQELLLQHGTVDPSSPEGDRKPLLDIAGAQRAMKLGGAKVAAICETVERLSGLDKGADKRAEGNSVPTDSSSTSSD